MGLELQRPHDRAAPQIPDYELLKKIGGGSYGEVWLARNVLGDFRAVKVVYRRNFEHERPYEREFEGIKKFEPISRLHESQVDILHVGRNDQAGYFYYVMELADDANSSTTVGADVRRLTSASKGQENSEPPHVGYYVPRTLKRELHERGRLPPAECIEIGLALTRALENLHSHGLVHRDIKPSNIIFIGGVPKLADIGLVATMDATISFVGTSGFLPPEGPGTPQADIYSLGKVLYEMSTGKERHEFPELPENLRDLPDHGALIEFNAVLVKACATDLSQRYQSPEQLRGDLELLRCGESVQRKRVVQQRWKFGRRMGIGAAIGTILVAGIISIKHSLPHPLDPLTTGKNVGGYPPTAMRGTINKDAWEHYRLGYHAFRRLTHEGNQQAEQHFNQAIELDPSFVLGYWGLWALKFSDTWLLSHADSDEWRRLADKMVALDKGLAETRQVLGFIRFWEWRWAEAEAEYREALRMNPDCIPAWGFLGFQLSHVGRTEEALRVLDRALQIDPNLPQLVKLKGHAYFVRRQFQRALDLYLESTHREPLFPQAHRWTARAYFAMTNYPAGIDELERYDVLRGERAPDEAKQEYAELRRAFEAGSVRGFWLKRLDLGRAKWKPDECPYTFAQIYAWLGDKEQALNFLQKAFERHDELIYLIFDECWDPWRDEPRFEAIRKKINMPRHPNFPAK